MKLWIHLCFVAAALILIDAESVPDESKKDHKRSEKSCEGCKGKSSGESFKFECSNNEWVHYMLDDAPAEEGVYIGDYGAGNAGFVGCGSVLDERGPARIQIIDPKGAYEVYGKGEVFINDTARMWYLKKHCDHQYTWVKSSNGAIVPNAVQPIEKNVNGAPVYVGRKVIDGATVVAGHVSPFLGYMLYADKNGQMQQQTTDYEVLTCRSEKFEAPKPKAAPAVPQPDSNASPNASPGCVHEWKKFDGGNTPDLDGVSAGLFDVNNKAYVGKVSANDLMLAGRVQTTNPGSGIYTTGGFAPFYTDKDAYYLVNNPNYHYYWVDSFSNNVVANAITIKLTESGLMSLYVGRIQFDGQMLVAPILLPVGLLYIRPDGSPDHETSFEVLACDPLPANRCKSQWKPYKNDNAPSVDGFAVDAYKDNIMSYVGRSDNKYVRGDDYTVGRVQIAPASASGVYTLNTVSGVEKFDNNSGEYLVKNPNDVYKWVNSHTGDDVKFALKVPMTTKGEYRHYDHAHTAFIGRVYVNNIVHVGTVYRDKGLAFFNVDGQKSVVSSYQVLTCTSSVPNAEVDTDSNGGDHEIEWFDSEFSSNNV